MCFRRKAILLVHGFVSRDIGGGRSELPTEGFLLLSIGGGTLIIIIHSFIQKKN